MVGAVRQYLGMTQRRIAVEFEGLPVDARALARAIAATFEASRAGHGTVFIEGFSMNPTDRWHVGDPQITITEK